MISPNSKTPKDRKRTVSQILRKAYSLHGPDKATRHALKVHLKDE